MRRAAILIFFPLYFIGSLPFMLVAWPLSKLNRQWGRTMAYGFTRSTSLILMWLAGAEFIVTGQEGIDPKQNYLFVANHRSLLDTPVLKVMVKKPLSFVSKMEVAKVPILKQWMILLNCLFLDRNDNRKALKTILQGIEQLKEGDNFAIFPQGTRSIGDEFLPFKAGSFKLATKSKKPLIPVTIWGTDDMFENNTFNIKPRKIYVHFHPVIETEALTLSEQKQLALDVETMIRDQFYEFRRLG